MGKLQKYGKDLDVDPPETSHQKPRHFTKGEKSEKEGGVQLEEANDEDTTSETAASRTASEVEKAQKRLKKPMALAEVKQKGGRSSKTQPEVISRALKKPEILSKLSSIKPDFVSKYKLKILAYAILCSLIIPAYKG